MEITINFPDEIENQIRQIQNIDAFVSEIVKKALISHSGQIVSDAGISKWKKIVRRIHDDPVHLAGYSKQLKKDISEFRENFIFADGEHGKISS
jgi:hypothetical protein